MHPAARALALLSLLASATGPALAAWPNDPGNGNVAVCTATGNQNDPRVASDGAGGVFVIWADARGATTDVYAQRIGASGAPLWAANGIPVGAAGSWQESPQLAGDGAGGFIAVWQDWRGVDADIYVQRVNAAGVPQWTANGVAVCTSAGNQLGARIVPDGAGGAILLWLDNRGISQDVYAQRVSAAGTMLWAANGVVVCNAAGTQYVLEAVTDGAAGAIAVWSDFRGGADYDLYAQRMSAGGAAQWAANGVVVCNAADNQYSFGPVADGAGGVIVAWDDLRSGSYDIYAQRVSPTGAMRWTPSGLVVCNATGTQTNALAVSDGSGGAIITWGDTRNGVDFDVYAQHLGASGGALWSANGFVLCSVAQNQLPLAALSDGAGGAIVAWQDGRGGIADDVYAQRVTGAGTPFWASGGVGLCTAVGSQNYAAAASDGAGGAIVAWRDDRSGVSSDLYAQRIEAYGNLGSPEPGITKVKDVTGDQGGLVKVSWNASYLDAAPNYSILDYRLWRSVPAASLTAGAMLARGFSADPDEAAAGDRYLALPAAANGYAWELAGTQAAGLLASYSLVAATTRDSLAGSNPLTAFMVEARAGTSMASDRWYSAPDSGYSVDNLAPAAPAPFTGQYAVGTTTLHWNRNTEADLAGYRLYRGTSVGFMPGPANLVVALPDTGYADPAGAPFVYKLTAVDAHGNESAVATVLPAGTTAVEAGAAPRAFFAIASANPARAGAATTLRFGLAAAGRASVTVYDASGRRVRELASGPREPGEHTLAWDGRDGAGRALAAGLYFARLEAPGFTATRKLVVQD